MIRCLVFAALTATLPTSLLAQDGTAAAPETEATRTFSLELNNAATVEGGICQLTYVATNNSGEDLSQAAYQVGFFDSAGIVRRILVLDFGALTPGKTRIVLFNLPDQPCEDLSRIVVNDVAQCALADGEVSDLCSVGLETTSRTDIAFGL
ncbi:MAG: hypothetical protein AAFY65_17910 [Pseudomonadota bacterium]